MKWVHIEPGAYVVAVSGGVDSMALLHMLHSKFPIPNSKFQFTVAHFEHGIRPDSDLDRQLVERAAADYGFSFVYDHGRLGPAVSEDTARRARYEFLERVRQSSGAKAIITAHHCDDLLETAVMNLLRGSGWRGLVSLKSRDTILRPLLDIPKSQLVDYAKRRELKWREDSTNQELRYHRNYLRHKLLNSLQSEKSEELLQQIRNIQKLQSPLESELEKYLASQPEPDRLDRHQFIMLPHAVAREVMAAWLRHHDVQDLSSDRLERLVRAAKTFAPGRLADADKNLFLRIGKNLALVPKERYQSQINSV